MKRSGPSFFAKNTKLLLILPLSLIYGLLTLLASCDSGTSSIGPVATDTPQLTASEVQRLITQAVDLADQMTVDIVVAVIDREANLLGAFSMTGTNGVVDDAVLGQLGAKDKARTAAYLSSNQHGFTSLTACYITRSHFPPGIFNTGGGPLYGVPLSSLGGGDVQPNGGAAPGVPGLSGIPGGVPVFKDGLLAGAVGISSTGSRGLDDFLQFVADFPEFLDDCGANGAVIIDEVIARGAVSGFEAPSDKRGDNIFLDGIRLLFTNTDPPDVDFSDSFSLAGQGTFDMAPIDAPSPAFPPQGEVDLSARYGPLFDFRIRGSGRADSNALTEEEVRRIIEQATAQANKTRAAIRRPIGTPARTFITVVDLDGTILGISRTSDATLFSYDVSAQKARTVVAFSDPNGPSDLGQMVRSTLGLDTSAPLAMTCRAVGFLSQRFYPPGIDMETLGRAVDEGPFYVVNSDNRLRQFDFTFQLNLGLVPFPNGAGNGITIFPGGVPLYKNGQLVGGCGVSGDGVDQDDLISFAGGVGFEPPEEIRCDQFFFNDIRLPYVKFPRQPEIDGGGG